MLGKLQWSDNLFFVNAVLEPRALQLLNETYQTILQEGFWVLEYWDHSSSFC